MYHVRVLNDTFLGSIFNMNAQEIADGLIRFCAEGLCRRCWRTKCLGSFFWLLLASHALRGALCVPHATQTTAENAGKSTRNGLVNRLVYEVATAVCTKRFGFRTPLPSLVEYFAWYEKLPRQARNDRPSVVAR